MRRDAEGRASEASRLLDRRCARVATAVESGHACELLHGVDVAPAQSLSEEAWLELLRARADVLEPNASVRRGALRALARFDRGVLSCLVRRGDWVDEVEDVMPPAGAVVANASLEGSVLCFASCTIASDT